MPKLRYLLYWFSMLAAQAALAETANEKDKSAYTPRGNAASTSRAALPAPGSDRQNLYTVPAAPKPALRHELSILPYLGFDGDYQVIGGDLRLAFPLTHLFAIGIRSGVSAMGSIIAVPYDVVLTWNIHWGNPRFTIPISFITGIGFGIGNDPMLDVLMELGLKVTFNEVVGLAAMVFSGTYCLFDDYPVLLVGGRLGPVFFWGKRGYR